MRKTPRPDCLCRPYGLGCGANKTVRGRHQLLLPAESRNRLVSGMCQAAGGGKPLANPGGVDFGKSSGQKNQKAAPMETDGRSGGRGTDELWHPRARLSFRRSCRTNFGGQYVASPWKQQGRGSGHHDLASSGWGGNHPAIPDCPPGSLPLPPAGRSFRCGESGE